MSEFNEALIPPNRHADRRVAIIGGGWAGLQLLQSLGEYGIEAVLYDRFATVGGTWTPNLSYQGLHLHSSAWLGAFEGMPFSDKQATNDGKPSAEEMHNYCNKFVDRNKLADKIYLNHDINEVHYDTATRKATLMVKKLDSAPSKEGPFDLVVYSSLSGKPDVPKIESIGFTGTQLHSSNLKSDVVADIVAKRQQVAVVGAGKSGADTIAALKKLGHEEVTWVFRKPYYFLRFERTFHNRSFLAMLRALLSLTCLVFFRFSPTLGIFALWLIGYAVLPSGFHFDAKRFHFGVLDRAQLSVIQGVARKVGNPQGLISGGLRLEDNAFVPCDVVIWATGYSTGIETLNLFKDGKPFGKECLNDRLFEHLVLPRFPCLMSAATAFFHFGPKRSVTTAAYIDFHLRREPVSEKEMMESADKLRTKVKATKFFGYQSDSCMVQDWLGQYEDFWWAGYLSFFRFIKMAVETFVLGVCNPLKLNFPKDNLARD